MTREAFVVVVMSAHEITDTSQLDSLAGAAGGTVAHLQMGDPTLSQELTRLADQGIDEITIVGASRGSLAPALSWLRRVAAHWWRERVPTPPRLLVSTTLVSAESDLPSALSSARPVHGGEAPLTSSAWEDVPHHRHQLLICRGPRCTAMGSDETAEAFVLALMDHRLSDDDVLITHTGCQFPCNKAPVVSVQPDDIWYGGVDRVGAWQIVDSHLFQGRPYSPKRLPRTRRAP